MITSFRRIALLVLIACAATGCTDPGTETPAEPGPFSVAAGREDAREAIAEGRPWIVGLGRWSGVVGVDESTGLPTRSLGCIATDQMRAYCDGYNAVVREQHASGELTRHELAPRIRDRADWLSLCDGDVGVSIAPPSGLSHGDEGSIDVDGHTLPLLATGDPATSWRLHGAEHLLPISTAGATARARVIDDGRTLIAWCPLDDGTDLLVTVLDRERGYRIAQFGESDIR